MKKLDTLMEKNKDLVYKAADGIVKQFSLEDEEELAYDLARALIKQSLIANMLLNCESKDELERLIKIQKYTSLTIERNMQYLSEVMK